MTSSRAVRLSDWTKQPGLIGQLVLQLPEGPFQGVDFPHPCPAGFVGGSTIEDQDSVIVSAHCPYKHMIIMGGWWVTRGLCSDRS